MNNLYQGLREALRAMRVFKKNSGVDYQVGKEGELCADASELLTMLGEEDIPLSNLQAQGASKDMIDFVGSLRILQREGMNPVPDPTIVSAAYHESRRHYPGVMRELLGGCLDFQTEK